MAKFFARERNGKNGFGYRIEGNSSRIYNRAPEKGEFDDTSSRGYRDLVEFRYRGPVTPDNSNLLIMLRSQEL